MPMNERIPGKINNRLRASQQLDFSGLAVGNKSPTDVDGLSGYGGRGFIYMEGKYKDEPLKGGQRIVLENVIKSHWKAGHPSICIWFAHDVADPLQDVVVHVQIVKAVFCRNKKGVFEWCEPETPQTVKQIVDRYQKKYNLKW